MASVVGRIERRLLINFRVDAGVLGRYVPPPFRPRLVAGVGMGGVCLIGISALRPPRTPVWIGVRSENMAHRFAVEWGDGGVRRQGVYIPRRDTASTWMAWAGGRVFPGWHRLSAFDVSTQGRRLTIAVRGAGGGADVDVVGQVASDFPGSSVFPSLEDASSFFRSGSAGYSNARRPGRYEGVELLTDGWSVEPFQPEVATTSFLGDAASFPRGSVEFDCALLMRGLDCRFRALPPLEAPPAERLACAARRTAITNP
ncbi:MAG TPA: hypothetical protein VKF59_11135 [Candidatus Dormibacteraeota bacterium]|nr:hypothetical protein [Candidatus Dormibacteraeota bacterium]